MDWAAPWKTNRLWVGLAAGIGLRIGAGTVPRETIERSSRGPRDGPRALFFPCSEATVHECADTNIYQQPGPCSLPVYQAIAAELVDLPRPCTDLRNR